MINPHIFYLSDKVSAASIRAAASISANATANVNAIQSLPDFPDITRPYLDIGEDFEDE